MTSIARFGTVAIRTIGWHLSIAGTPGQRRFVNMVELLAKEKDVAEAFFDQITTAARQRAHSRAERAGHRRSPPFTSTKSRQKCILSGFSFLRRKV